MPAISYDQIDQIFLPWARQRGLHVYTVCKDEPIRTTRPHDQWMNEYDLGVSPDYDSQDELVIVGCCLMKRSGKMHTFYRERRNFDFRSKVSLPELTATLDEAFDCISKWEQQLTPPNEEA